jgi:hypothetical protein
MSSSLDLAAYSRQDMSVFWDQWENGWLERSDRLRFQFSGDGGSNWGSLITAFSNDIGSSPQSFSYVIPDAYLTSDFKMRFYLDNFGGSGEYCYIDDISIGSLEYVADTTAFFEIDGDRVYFDGNGDPQMDAWDTEELTADSYQVINNLDYGNPHGYSYACKKDVTELIRAFTAEGPNGNYPGNSTYTVGGVDATWDANDEWAYAGWSLVIIFRSSSTYGQRIYLYDDFLYANHQTNLDFDSDGEPGGTIGGFVAPQLIAGEVNAAKITCFVGEGDDYYNGDFIALNAPDNDPTTYIPASYKLSDGVGSRNDVWNGQSLGMGAEGVDIDTFYVTWSSGLLSSGDTSAQLDIYTDVDIWNLVYVILSFRSETTTGGITSYSIS